MSYTASAISTAATSTGSWQVKYKDLGKKDSDQTGIIGDHQVHVTVTNTTSSLGTIGWHISVYQLGADGHLLNDYNPDNAVARVWCFPGGVGMGKRGASYSDWGVRLLDQNGRLLQRHLSVSRMKGYKKAWKEEAWKFFFEIFPKYEQPTTFVEKEGDYPALVKSTASRPIVATSASSSASSSSSSSSASSTSSSSSSTMTKSASST